jgi:hypothetical protein
MSAATKTTLCIARCMATALVAMTGAAVGHSSPAPCMASASPERCCLSAHPGRLDRQLCPRLFGPRRPQLGLFASP